MLRQTKRMEFYYTAGRGKQGKFYLLPNMSFANPAYIGIAEVEGNQMVVMNERPLDEALVWARQWCGSFSLLPA